MILDIQFIESNQSFDCKFGEINNVSDGGYERGYEKGYEDGFDDGFDDAYKEEQAKSIDITENCTTEVTPDEDMVLSKVTIKVDVPDKSEEIGVIIDESGVLDSTDGTVTEKVEQLIDKAEQTRLWDLVVFKNSAFQNQNSPFMNWAEKTIPKINFGEITTLIYSFSNSNVEYIDYYINSKKATNFNSCFSNCKNLVWLVGVDTSSATYCTEIFQNCTSLESITEPFDVSKITSFNKAFNGCEKLKEIRFVPETIKVSIAILSTVLSDESIQSIFNGLADVSSGEPQKITLHSMVIDRLPDECYWIMTAKNWYLG